MNNRKQSSVNLENEGVLKIECPFIYTLSLMGKRWKPAILWKMMEGSSRFGQFKKLIPQISEKMLAQHLKELEEDGLITRTVFSQTPLRVEYALTEIGISLYPVLYQLQEWSENTRKKIIT